MKNTLKLLFFVGLSLVGPSLQLKAQVAEAAASVTTGIVVDQLIADVDELIEQSMQRLDFAVAKTALEMKGVITAWRDANTDLLNTAFDKLEEASRNNFSRARALVSNMDEAAEKRITQARELAELSNQIVESIVFSGKRTYVLRQEPQIVPPTSVGSFLVKIRGVNLDRSNPTLLAPDGTATTRLQVNQQEVRFRVPIETVINEENKARLFVLSLSYKTNAEGFWAKLTGRKDVIKKEIPVIALPSFLGHYRLESQQKVQRRVEESFRVNVGQFRGTNTRVEKIAKPGEGWKWDLTKKFTHEQIDGEKGNFQHFDFNRSTSDGVIVVARCDEIKNIRHPGGTAGYVTIRIRGTRYKMVDERTTGQPLEGTIDWLKDVEIPFPENTTKFALRVKLFDGRERIITNEDKDKFFEVIREPNRIIVRPKIPADLVL